MYLRQSGLVFVLFAYLLAPMRLAAQTDSLAACPTALTKRLNGYFDRYRLAGFSPVDPLRPAACRLDSAARTVRITLAEAFVEQPLTAARVEGIQADLQALLAPEWADYALCLVDRRGRSLREHVPNRFRTAEEVDSARLWRTNYAGRPWTENVSRPWWPSGGLDGRHIFVWPSHGRFWHEGTEQWSWQRPRLFVTCEDLLSQSFVYPLLVPMLESAGAVVGLPRERDGQTAWALADNDAPERPEGAYFERGKWAKGTQAGFALPLHRAQSDSLGLYPPAAGLMEGENPFTLGSSRRAATSPEGKPTAVARWSLRPPRDGHYAVYVSYATEADAVDDAHYAVHHAGGTTHFRVNQRMGGRTWVYLGTFYFRAAGNPAAIADNKSTTTKNKAKTPPPDEAFVELTNESARKGCVSADAVRIGGGMGLALGANRVTSGLPAALECSVPFAQWAGMPEEVYRSDGGALGYDADIRTRSNMLARLGGTSPYQPDSTGLGVPFELSVALHTDAGIRHDGLVGMLSIATTEDAAGATHYASGVDRRASLDLGDCILSQIQTDLDRSLGTLWPHRGLRDRNYGETRSPRVPAVIVEMLSHQNFEDMKQAHDPHFKFLMARAVYKGILRYSAFSHGHAEPTVQPLPPHGLSALLVEGKDSVTLRWHETPDPLEPSARAEGYIVYTGDGRGGFDNGLLVDNSCRVTLPVERGRLYAFRVAAVNAGGESFASATVVCFRTTADHAPEVLVVDGFDRLSGPAWVDHFGRKGFDLDEDLGVPAGRTDYFCGRQRIFDLSPQNVWGTSGDELEGRTIAGNTRDVAAEHGRALAVAGRFSLSSAEVSALTTADFPLDGFTAIDYAAGLNRNAPQNRRPYRALPPSVRRRMAYYLQNGGNVLLSGAYLGSDMTDADERAFCRETLYYNMGGVATDKTEFVRGLGLDRIPLVRRWNDAHYAATQTDMLLPEGGAFSVFAYGDGTSAGIAYGGRTKKGNLQGHRVIALGFPVECIADEGQRGLALDALLRFLTE